MILEKTLEPRFNTIPRFKTHFVFALKVWREVYARQLICARPFFKIIIFELFAIGPPNCCICSR